MPENERHPLPFRLDLHGVLTWEGELGVGLRGDLPLFTRTGVYEGRDELALSLGIDVSLVDFGGVHRLTMWPTAAVQWSLSVTERFVFYPEFGIVAEVRPDDFRGLFPNVGFGGRVFVYRELAVLGRIGWPMAASIGLTY